MEKLQLDCCYCGLLFKKLKVKMFVKNLKGIYYTCIIKKMTKEERTKKEGLLKQTNLSQLKNWKYEIYEHLKIF